MKKLILGLMLLAGTVSFANNSSAKKVTSLQKKVEVVRVICYGYTTDGDRVTLSCATCTTEAQCQAKLKALIAA